MPNYQTIFSGLRRATSPQQPSFQDINPTVDPDPALMLDFLQGQRIDETRDRLFNAQRAPSPDSSINAPALKGLLQRHEDDRAGSFINSIQAPQVEAVRGANLGAAMEGFGDPQEQAFYGRQIAEEKMRQPLEEARVRGRTAVDQAEAQTRGQIELQNQMHKNFMEQLREFGASGLPLAGMSSSRTGNSVRVQPDRPEAAPKAMAGAAGLIADLPRLRYFAESGDPAAVAAYNTAKFNALSTRTDIDENIRNDVYNMSDWPELKNKPWEQVEPLLRSGQFGGDPENKTPQEWLQLREAWNLLNGAPLPQ